MNTASQQKFSALLLFAFAIVAVLIALCGHHWQKPPGGN